MPIFGETSTGPKLNPGEEYGKALNRMTKDPLSPFQQRELAEGIKHPFYIYNVSPIHEWPRFQGQLGTVTIQKAPWLFDGPLPERVSLPVTIQGAICRLYDAGDRKMKPFIEGGLEVVEDIVGCSEKYPPQDPNANLTNFGVFYLTSLFRDLKPKEQEAVFDKAWGKFELKCRQLIQQADQIWAGDPTKRNFIQPIHLKALACANEVDGAEAVREWAPKASGKKFKTCQFCQSRLSVDAVTCMVCKEVVDAEKYAKLKSGK